MSSGASALNSNSGVVVSGGVSADAGLTNSVPHSLQCVASSLFSRPQYVQGFMPCVNVIAELRPALLYGRFSPTPLFHHSSRQRSKPKLSFSFCRDAGSLRLRFFYAMLWPHE